MPDISMCLNLDCSLSENCYRSPASGTKESEFRQSWADFKQEDDLTCDYFWPNSPVDNQT
jgi:hypothetical protein